MRKRITSVCLHFKLSIIWYLHFLPLLWKEYCQSNPESSILIWHSPEGNVSYMHGQGSTEASVKDDLINQSINKQQGPSLKKRFTCFDGEHADYGRFNPHFPDPAFLGNNSEQVRTSRYWLLSSLTSGVRISCKLSVTDETNTSMADDVLNWTHFDALNPRTTKWSKVNLHLQRSEMKRCIWSWVVKPDLQRRWVSRHTYNYHDANLLA